ncbi:glyoxylate/hydroxypyruvate reductase A [Pseudohoeflea suaedae]|uniref:Glyoxylate/hydroxypyruvate reductase A n=2 Tax=Pseudohoeflea suaedae TaxID=877384 RepID=A0A4R5PQG6_9HYPH|nr:glyoxylate/hydroxypyruvate reductase A [Pseudohoeflea suaedae]TDH39380.1 glyoxylate/hydroxypyruvate reductase A [Pseudohoeflea suaedae]
MSAERILLSAPGWDSELWIGELEKHAPGRDIVLETDGATDPSIRFAVVWKQPEGLLSSLPNLKAIFSLGAGVDHIFKDTTLPDVPIVRIVSDDLTARMSEYVVWQVLDHHRNGPRYRRQQQNHSWGETRQQASADDVTVGIMGLGELGRDSAAKLNVLGFKVTGWSRRQQDVDGVTCFAGPEGFGDFLASADIFVVLLPLTDETRGILGLETFRRMTRRGPLGAPVLINAGRGGLQVEADIVAALDEGLLSAASLDVFEAEPLGKDSPLWEHPKVTVTPHAAASSNAARLAGPIVEQMKAYDRGEPLANLVDKSAGY